VKLPSSLIALSPGDLDERATPRFVELVRRCVEAGLESVLVREPGLSDKATLRLAIALRRELAAGWLAIHDRVHLAADAGADAVHLGFRSLSVPAARSILNRDIALGFSAHDTDDPAAWSACDYLFFGPVLDTPSKRGVKEPVGFDGLAHAVSRTRTPMWALGGMKPEDARLALESGARGLAVLGGIFRAERPAAACTQYVEALRALGHGGPAR
jgi:thiamine-phosphate pyrophosphorylase